MLPVESISMPRLTFPAVSIETGFTVLAGKELSNRIQVERQYWEVYVPE